MAINACYDELTKTYLVTSILSKDSRIKEFFLKKCVRLLSDQAFARNRVSPEKRSEERKKRENEQE